MDSSEYQKTIQKLEASLREKQEELDGISARKAAIQLKGMAGLSAQVEELALLNQQLQNAKDRCKEKEQKVGRFDELELTIAEQQDEIRRLLQENAALKVERGAAAAQETEVQAEDNPKEAWAEEKAALERHIEKLQGLLDKSGPEGPTEKRPEPPGVVAEESIADARRANISSREERPKAAEKICPPEPHKSAVRSGNSPASSLLPKDIMQKWIK